MPLCWWRRSKKRLVLVGVVAGIQVQLNRGGRGEIRLVSVWMGTSMWIMPSLQACVLFAASPHIDFVVGVITPISLELLDFYGSNFSDQLKFVLFTFLRESVKSLLCKSLCD